MEMTFKAVRYGFRAQVLFVRWLGVFLGYEQQKKKKALVKGGGGGKGRGPDRKLHLPR